MKTSRILAMFVATTLLATAIPASAAVALPNSMTALGDSVTRGFNACGWYTDCVAGSWSTGTNPSSHSHYLKIKAANPAIGNRVFNDARTGAKMAELPDQAKAAVSHGVDYLTILMGANDICTQSEALMTPVATYRKDLDTALATLKSGLPNATVYLLSLPDVRHLWSIAKDDSSARSFWSVAKICQSVLVNPTSTAQADVDRRGRVRQRTIDYNTQLQQACQAYGSRCVYDENRIFNYPFKFEQISRWDYFHPNAEGQKVLADITYRLH